ncbi:hypothetical protein Q8A67_020375 [Cirrhinus molitorella]|uniref:Uncharacterized protein n=1 Tax=Cirrhinus molitorella TaxID=172907 RepID=A0AA88P567_9TELE|nr:hypothetical protein Q8A67_020375 [Cirrhinus molitorella]
MATENSRMRAETVRFIETQGVKTTAEDCGGFIASTRCFVCGWNCVLVPPCVFGHNQLLCSRVTSGLTGLSRELEEKTSPSGESQPQQIQAVLAKRRESLELEPRQEAERIQPVPREDSRRKTFGEGN